jgi:PPOX class probable F420-dependent enzyme
MPATLDPQEPAHARVLDRFATEVAVWLTTVTAEGQPQSTPVWFHWDEGMFLLYSQPTAPKLRNIAANPRVSLHLVGEPDAEEGVTIEGRAVVDPDAPRADAIDAYMGKYRGLIAGYGWTPASMAADYSVAVRVTPTRFRLFD